ncbi:hypothetical protein NIES4102_41740 (plasmid) [Chondrocystis sp. NIES-4102]|nr:hypothetical protein NIES4102_41740 [Chondrocystis sp. NIES-4102]
MKLCKCFVLTTATLFSITVSSAKNVFAQVPIELSTAGFSGGTITFPNEDNTDVGDITGIEELTGISVDDVTDISNIRDIVDLIGIGSIVDLLPPAVAEVFSDLSRIVGVVETFLSELGIQVDIGDLNLPYIEEALELFESNSEIDIASDVFGSQTGSTVIIDDTLYKQYLKDIANRFAQNSTLSKDGQKVTAEQIKTSQTTSEISNRLAQNSNRQDVSQNILRNISNQLALQQQIDNMSFFNLSEDKIARSLLVSMQGESLVALDKITITRDRETAIALKSSTYYQGLLSIPAQHLLP